MWETRGWTYQEATLGRRRLYLTSLTAFFECQHSVSHEDLYNSDYGTQNWSSPALTLPEDRSRFEAFCRHVENYTSRSLTYRSDTYNAFNGVQKSLYSESSTFIYGMPQVDFDRALCWIHEGNVESAATESYVEGPDSIILPTWSWSSTMQLPGRNLSNQQNDFYGLVTPWFTMDKSSLLDLSDAINAHMDTSIDDGWQLYMAVACSQNIVTTGSFSLSLENQRFRLIEDRAKSRWKSYMDFCTEVTHLTSKSITENGGGVASLTQIMKPGVILSRTQTASFHLRPDPRIGHDECYVMGTGTDRDTVIGRIWGTACLSNELELELQVDNDDNDDIGTTTSTTTTRLYEFIPLSLSSANDETPDQLPAPLVETKKYFDADGTALGKILVLNVLLIGWRRKQQLTTHYAYRRFYGHVFLKDWAAAPREWKTVLLE